MRIMSMKKDQDEVLERRQEEGRQKKMNLVETIKIVIVENSKLSNQDERDKKMTLKNKRFRRRWRRI